MPASPLANLAELGVVALVADRCAAGCLVLGPTTSGSLPTSESRFRQEIDGVIVGEGSLSCLSAPPEVLFAEFIALAREHGAPVSAGDWVATGGITPCAPYRSGQRVTVHIDDVAVIDVTIDASIK
jgi:2-keto-4-pentenoate hydratase